LKRLATEKHSSLLALFVSDYKEDKKVLNICTSWLSLSMQVKHFFLEEKERQESLGMWKAKASSLSSLARPFCIEANTMADLKQASFSERKLTKRPNKLVCLSL
jgi:hypothetical protein